MFFVKMLNEDLMVFFGVKQLRHGNKRGKKDFSLLQELFLPIIPLSIKKSILYAGQDLNSFLPRNEARVSFEYTEDNNGRDYFSDGFICEGTFDAYIQSSL